MQKIKTDYTLREFCKLLGVSVAWIYKVETYLGLRDWASNLSGKKSIYNQYQIDFFRKVHFLRFVQVGLPDIKRIYDLERKIEAIVRGKFDFKEEKDSAAEWMKRMEEKGEKKVKGETGYVELYLMEGTLGGTEGVGFNKNKYKSK